MNEAIFVAIDPGQKKSGLVICFWNGVSDVPSILDAGVFANNEVLRIIVAEPKADAVVIERVVSHGAGQPASQALIDTAHWSGCFMERASPLGVMLTRSQVTKHLGVKRSGGSPDSQIRNYLIQRYATQARTSPSLVVTGDLRGVTSHAWQALAVGVTWFDRHRLEMRLTPP